MPSTKIAGTGMYVPENIVTNADLAAVMETSDAWIKERTGVAERRYALRYRDSTSSLGVNAAKMAIENSGITNADIDFIIFATLSPDYYFPGCGVLLQRSMNMGEIPALDIRNQCSGFLYGLSVGDQFIKTGMYKNILLVGAEIHSYGLDYSNAGRHISVIFGDGAGAVVLQPTEKKGQGILSTHLHSDGKNAEILSMINPGFHGGVHDENKKPPAPHQPYGNFFAMENPHPQMDGPAVFKKAAEKMPEAVMEALRTNNLQPSDIDLLIPHQANLRISQALQQKLGLSDAQVYNNIQRYGNTTAASIPIALCEAWQQGKIKEDDLVCFTAFGSGFTWGSALVRW
ncbi:MAG TPA: beta-ketoacyl-ACP synthase III [Chitinophagaceae bacterium]|nr:beta-ketoacyl-ACP synthase III [Chitinophagaceae bacterium]